MVEMVATSDFDTWIRKLKDRHARLRILERLDRLAHGNPGDVKPVGAGISELRLTYGPGFRVYYLQESDVIIVLLIGGDKSTQRKDIAAARRLAQQWRSERRPDR